MGMERLLLRLAVVTVTAFAVQLVGANLDPGFCVTTTLPLAVTEDQILNFGGAASSSLDQTIAFLANKAELTLEAWNMSSGALIHQESDSTISASVKALSQGTTMYFLSNLNSYMTVVLDPNDFPGSATSYPLDAALPSTFAVFPNGNLCVARSSAIQTYYWNDGFVQTSAETRTFSGNGEEDLSAQLAFSFHSSASAAVVILGTDALDSSKARGYSVTANANGSGITVTTKSWENRSYHAAAPSPTNANFFATYTDTGSSATDCSLAVVGASNIISASTMDLTSYFPSGECAGEIIVMDSTSILLVGTSNDDGSNVVKVTVGADGTTLSLAGVFRSTEFAYKKNNPQHPSFSFQTPATGGTNLVAGTQAESSAHALLASASSAKEVGMMYLTDSSACSGATSCSDCSAICGCGWCASTLTCVPGDFNDSYSSSEDDLTTRSCVVNAWEYETCFDCGTITGSVECGSNDKCGWCASTLTCMQGNDDGPFSSTDVCEVWAGSVTVDCTDVTTCGDCSSNTFCGWCEADNSCMWGTTGEGLFPTATPPTCVKDDGSSGFYGSTCPSCSSTSECGTCSKLGSQCGWCQSSGECTDAAVSPDVGPLSGSCDVWGGATCDACFSGSTCGECTTTDGCSWCLSSGTCTPDTLIEGSSCSSLAPETTSCPACSTATDCGGCAAVAGCGWCELTQSCAEGSLSGSTSDFDHERLTGKCEGWAFNFSGDADQCLSSVCGAFSGTDPTGCLAHGYCHWALSSYQCIPGDSESPVVDWPVSTSSVAPPGTESTVVCNMYNDDSVSGLCIACGGDPICSYCSAPNTTNALTGVAPDAGLTPAPLCYVPDVSPVSCGTSSVATNSGDCEALSLLANTLVALPEADEVAGVAWYAVLLAALIVLWCLFLLFLFCRRRIGRGEKGQKVQKEGEATPEDLGDLEAGRALELNDDMVEVAGYNAAPAEMPQMTVHNGHTYDDSPSSRVRQHMQLEKLLTGCVVSGSAASGAGSSVATGTSYHHGRGGSGGSGGVSGYGESSGGSDGSAPPQPHTLPPITDANIDVVLAAIEAHQDPSVVRDIVSVLRYAGDERLVAVFAAAVARETQVTSDEEVNTLFRNESPATRIHQGYAYSAAHEALLHPALSPSAHWCVGQEDEVHLDAKFVVLQMKQNGTRVPGEQPQPPTIPNESEEDAAFRKAERDVNLQAHAEDLVDQTHADLCAALDNLLEDVADAVERCPAPLREMYCILHDCVDARFPGRGRAAVGSFLFLRLLSPVLASAPHYGLLDASSVGAGTTPLQGRATNTSRPATTPMEPKAQMWAVTITRLLQVLSNSLSLPGDEVAVVQPNIIPLQEFMKTRKFRMVEIVDAVLGVSSTAHMVRPDHAATLPARDSRDTASHAAAHLHYRTRPSLGEQQAALTRLHSTIRNELLGVFSRLCYRPIDDQTAYVRTLEPLDRLRASLDSLEARDKRLAEYRNDQHASGHEGSVRPLTRDPASMRFVGQLLAPGLPVVRALLSVIPADDSTQSNALASSLAHLFDAHGRGAELVVELTATQMAQTRYPTGILRPRTHESRVAQHYVFVAGREYSQRALGFILTQLTADPDLGRTKVVPGNGFGPNNSLVLDAARAVTMAICKSGHLMPPVVRDICFSLLCECNGAFPDEPLAASTAFAITNFVSVCVARPHLFGVLPGAPSRGHRTALRAVATLITHAATAQALPANDPVTQVAGARKFVDSAHNDLAAFVAELTENSGAAPPSPRLQAAAAATDMYDVDRMLINRGSVGNSSALGGADMDSSMRGAGADLNQTAVAVPAGVTGGRITPEVEKAALMGLRSLLNAVIDTVAFSFHYTAAVEMVKTAPQSDHLSPGGEDDNLTVVNVLDTQVQVETSSTQRLANSVGLCDELPEPTPVPTTRTRKSG